MLTVVAQHLLLADLALEHELAEVEVVAAALEQALAGLARGGENGFSTQLAKHSGVDGTQIDALLRESEAMGDVDVALDRQGCARRLARLLPEGGPLLRAALAERGIAVQAALRSMPEGRYVDYVPVGKGGMGIVYLARDVELNREVALKFLHVAKADAAGDVTPMDPSGLDWSPGPRDARRTRDPLEARFLQEAWITGSMTHPGIAPVYELGQTGAGVPYYTMRFIEGRRTLADAIDEVRGEPFERRLPLLDVFLDVCDTMRYAHSRGVLHRDLKPSNVVLGEFGEVVVVDWGLARVQDRPDRTVDLFRRRAEAFRAASDLHTMVTALGTPGYMAPEAADGDVEGVDARSDVYSLSAVLFEILTGSLPIPVHSIPQYLAAVREGDVADAHAVCSEVPGPLSRLCEHGLRLDPGQRLGSVEKLAADVRRWQREVAIDREVDALAREAETALAAARDASGPAVLPHLELASHASRRIQSLRPDSAEAADFLHQISEVRTAHVRALERAARTTLARRVSVAAVAIAAVVALAVSIVLEQRRQEAADARAAATASRDRAERVMTFMAEDLQDELAPLGRLDLLTKIGARARAYYENQPLQGATAAALTNRATAMRRLGDVLRLRGDLPNALGAYRAASAAGRQIDARGGSGNLGAFLIAVSGAREGEVLILQGLSSRGRDVLLQHQAALDRLSGLRPGDTELLSARSDVVARLARVLFAEGQPREGLRLAEHALSLAEHAKQATTGAARCQHRMVLQRRLLVAAMRYGPEGPEGAIRLRALTKEIQGLRQQARDDVRWQTLEASAHREVARAYSSRGLYADAEEAMNMALAFLKRHAERDPTNLAWASKLASALRQQGDVLLALKRPAEALRLYRASYDRMRRLSAQDPTNAGWLTQLITLCDRHVVAGTRLGEPPSNRNRWRREAVRLARILGARDPKNARHRHIIAYTMHSYATHLHTRSELGPALALSSECEAILDELLADNPDNMEAAVLLGWNASLAFRIRSDQAVPVQALGEAGRAEYVLGRILRRRPDYWMVRVELIQLQLARATLLASGPGGDVEAAARLHRSVESSVREGLAQKRISAHARNQLEVLRERARATGDPAARSK